MTISEDTMKFYKLAWHYLGLWSLEIHRSRRCRWYNVYSILAHFTTLIIFNLGIVLSLLTANSIGEMIDTLLIAASSCSAIIKFLLFVTSRHDISKLLDIMKRLEDISVTDSRERAILLAAQRKSALTSTFFAFTSGTIITAIWLNSIFNWDLMWPFWYPIDWQSNYVCYSVVNTFQLVCTIFIAAMVTSVDMWRAAAFLMLAGYFDVLRGRFQRLGWNNAEDLKIVQLMPVGMHRNTIHEQELIDCIKYHLLCLRYFRVLEQACKLHYFMQLAISAVLICATAFLLTTVHPKEEFPKFCWLLWHLFGVCFQLVIPCFFGSLLVDKTDQLPFNLYESNWPDMSPKFKLTMSVVLESNKTPLQMRTFWNVFFISLPTFVSVVRAAYSMLSFLKGIE